MYNKIFLTYLIIKVLKSAFKWKNSMEIAQSYLKIIKKIVKKNKKIFLIFYNKKKDSFLLICILQHFCNKIWKDSVGILQKLSLALNHILLPAKNFIINLEGKIIFSFYLLEVIKLLEHFTKSHILLLNKNIEKIHQVLYLFKNLNNLKSSVCL